MTDQASFEDRLRRQIEAYHEAALVYAAAKLGLPDRLAAGPATSEQLAKSLGLSTPHLNRFLRGLCSMGICEELADGAFALTQAANRCDRTRPPGLLRKSRSWSDNIGGRGRMSSRASRRASPPSSMSSA